MKNPFTRSRRRESALISFGFRWRISADSRRRLLFNGLFSVDGMKACAGFWVLCIGLDGLLSPTVRSATATENSRVTISILDKARGKTMPGRVHLKSSDGKPVRPEKLPFWRDHFVCDGTAQLDLQAGTYSYEVERGPEYSSSTGAFTMLPSAETNVTVTLQRLVDLASEGWWSGDLHVHRVPADAELLMRAEDLHVAQFITWWNKQNLWTKTQPPVKPLLRFDRNRFCHLLAGEDEREGGALLYFNLTEPLNITNATRHFPPSLVYATEARKLPGVWIDMEKPFWWDFPIWVASGLCDSVGLANNHMCRSEMLDNEAWGRGRDRERLPGPRGNGFWTQEIYYHLLNCGLRIPPSAGSASGVLPNPLGYNRVYVQVDGKFSYEKWWEGLKAGRSFVSNGPLLRCRANGKWPGHVFTAAEGKEISIDLKAALTSRDPIGKLEIIRDGREVRTVLFAPKQETVDLGRLVFNESGWFLVRAFSIEPRTFRFASSAPFYVEIGANKQRISKASTEFFVDWLAEWSARVQLTDAGQRAETLRFQRLAERYWRGVLAQANAE